jgi:HD-GYP domain-containing protein (c-di-GMP phosphodiesterase class II)
LKGEEIPLEGRIVAIADIYDTLRSKKVYKKAFDHETSCKIISAGDGRTAAAHFDPRVLSMFLKMKDEFAEIYERNPD